MLGKLLTARRDSRADSPVQTNKSRLRAGLAGAAVLALVAGSVGSGLMPANADVWKQDLPGADTVGAQAVTTTTYLTNVVTSSSSATAKAIPNVDINALYGVDIPQTANTAGAPYNAAILDPSTGKNTVQFAFKAPVASMDQRTIAVDSGMGNGREGFYVLTRNQYVSTVGTPAGMVPVWFFAPGDTKASAMYYVPETRYFGYTTATWTSGGIVVNQKTGMLYANWGLVQYLGGASDQEARFSIFDPKTLTTYWSGPLQPATPADKLWNGAVVANGTSTVAPGIGITASGDLVILVKGTDRAIAATDPINTAGKAINAGDTSIGFLVRVHPSLNNDPWTYSVMKMITMDPTNTAGKTLFSNNIAAMAFLDGKFILETLGAEMYSVDPMTGLYKYLSLARSASSGPVTGSVAPQIGLFSAMTTAQTATSLTGHIYKSTSATYDTTTPLPGVKVALYEQNPARGFNEPTLVSTAITDSSGLYTFIVSDKNPDGSVKYFVRPVQSIIDGQPSVVVAGGEKTDPPFAGLANQGTLYCSDGTKYASADDGVMVYGPCPGLPNPPALETVGQAVVPTTFGAYGEIVMRSEWDDPVVNFVLADKSALTPSITSPKAGDAVTTASPEIKGRGITVGDTVTVMDGANQVCTATVQPDLSWFCTPETPLPSGSHTLKATEKDAAGNTSSPSAPVTFTVDAAPRASLAVSPASVTVGSEITATVTVKDSAGAALPGVKVTFAKTSAAVSLSAATCDTTASGTCSVKVTSATAGVYTSEISATVPGATVTGSPATVTFTAAPTGGFSWPNSSFTVTPAADLADRTTWVTADGVAYYTGKLTAKDSAGNLLKDLNLTDISFTATTAAVQVSAVTNNGDGTYTARFTSTVADTTPRARVYYTATQVGSGVDIPFKAGAPVPGPVACGAGKEGTHLTLTPVSAQAGSPVTASALVTDAFCNPVPGVTVDFGATGSATTAPASAVTGPDGIAKAQITDNVAETIDVTASSGVPLWNSPQSLTFVPGGFAWDKSYVTVTPAPSLADQATWVTADGVTPYKVTLHAMDALGNPLKALATSDIAFTGSTAAVKVAATTNNGDGTYSADYTSKVADQATLAQVKYKTVQVGEAKPVPFKAGAPVTGPITCDDPAKSGSTLFVTPAPLPVGEPAYAEALVTDQFCNPVAGVPVTFSIDAGTDGILIVNGGHTDASGMAYASLTDNTAETVVLHAAIPAGELDGSPHSTTFVSTGFSFLNSTFTVTPAVALTDKPAWIAADGVAHYRGTLKAVDDSFNPITNLTASEIAFAASSPDVKVSAITNAGGGNYVVDYTTTRADAAYTTSVSYLGHQVGSVLPIPFKAGPPVTSATCADGRPGTDFSTVLTLDHDLLLVGDPTTARALVTDAFCNPVEGVEVTFTVTGSGTASDGTTTAPTLKVTTDSNGLATATITDDVQEIITVHALIGGSDIQNSPVTLEYRTCWFTWDTSTFTVAPAASLTDPATWVTANGVAAYVGTLTARDINGDPLNYLHVTAADFATSDKVVVSDVVNNGDGTYTVRFTSTVADATTVVTPSHDGVPQPDRTYPIPFKAGAPVAGPTACGDGRPGTNLSISPKAVQAGGAATATVLVTDAYCNPVPGVPVTFAASGSATVTATPVLTGPDGYASATVRDNVAETINISVSPGVWNSPQPVTFTPGDFSYSASTFAVTPVADVAKPTTWVVADGVAAYTGKLAAKDALGNPLPGLAVTDIAFAAPAGVTVSAVVNNGDGTYQVTYTSTVANDKPVTSVKYRAIQVGADAPVPFRAGSPVVGPVTCGDGRTGSSLTVSPTSLAQGGSADVVVLVTDAFCNPVPGVAVTFGADGSAKLTGTTGVTGPDGKATTKVADDVAESVKVTAGIPGGALAGSPFLVTFNDVTAPGAPAITSPGDGALVGTDLPTVSGTAAEPGGTVIVRDGADVVCTAEVGDDLKWTCLADKPLPDGDHTLAATQTDKAGNESAPSNPVKIKVDKTAPPAPAITSPAPGATVGNDKPVISGTGEQPGNTVVVRDGADVICTTEVKAGGTWSCTPDKPLKDGDHTLKATETDPAGNESAPSAPVTIKVDTTAPAAPAITSPGNGAKVGDQPTISGTGAEAGNDVVVRDDAGIVCTAKVQPGLSWSCVADKPLGNGDHTLKATETDPAGNESAPSAPVTIKVDTTVPVPPAPAITAPKDGDLIGSKTPVVGGTGSKAGDTVTVTARHPDGSQAVVCVTEVQADLKWTCEPAGPLAEGANRLTATETDKSGQASAPSAPVTVTVDTIAPVPPAITGPAAGATVGTAKPTISGTGSAPGGTIVVRDGDGEICRATVLADLTWLCTSDKALGDGDHTLKATETDKAGNVSAPSAPVKITVDTKPAAAKPASPVLDPSNGSSITGRTPPGTTVTVKDPAGNPVAGCIDVRPDDQGNFECTPEAKLPPGAEVTVIAKDATGRTSDPAKETIRGLKIEVHTPVLYALDYQTVTGYNFNPGESVHLIVASNPLDGGYRTADADGAVTFTFQVPATFEPGGHTATLIGATSGSIADRFTVVADPRVVTGGLAVPGSGPTGLLTSLLLLGLGVGTTGVIITRRNRPQTR